MNQFNNNLSQESNYPNDIKNNNNIKIINNSENLEESNNNLNQNISKTNQISNDETYSNNENNNESNTEDNEDNSEGTDLEREAAILLNKQYDQIKKLKEELFQKNNEINKLNQIIDQMNSKLTANNENINLFNDLNNQIEILTNENRDLRNELNNKDQLIYELKADLNSLSQKFNDLNNNLNSLSQADNNEKMNQLLALNKKYLKEIKANEEKINIYRNEISKLNQNLKNEMRLKQKFEILYNEKIKEEKQWISQVNQDIDLICQWINNYIGVYFDKNIEIPDVPSVSSPISSENILIYNKFDFEKLRREIFETRKKVWDKQMVYETNIENLRKEQIDFIDKINKLNRDIVELNNDNFSLKEELNKRNINLDILQSQMNKYDN